MKKTAKTVALLVSILMLIAMAGCQAATQTPGAASSGSAAEASSAAVSSSPAASDSSAASNSAPASKDGKTIEVSLLVKKLSSSFWTDMESGVKDACQELGWTLRPTLCPITPDSNEEQIKLLEQDLLDPPDLYILCPADSKGIAPAIQEINKVGVPIINVNTRIANDDKSLDVKAFVGVDCRQISNQLSEEMVKYVNGKANMIILQGTTGSQTGIDYYEGAVEIYKKYPDMKILDSHPANYARQEGMTVTQNLLQKYDNIDMIHACNLEMALGASVAVEQAGRKGIRICTVNMSKEGAQALKDGKISIIADDNPYNVARTAIKTGKDVLDGKTVNGDVICPATLVQDGTDVAKQYYEKYGIK